jgi:hypothetical protein
MTGTSENISSMISFIETNLCLRNFTLKSSRTDLTRKIAAEFKDR